MPDCLWPSDLQSVELDTGDGGWVREDLDTSNRPGRYSRCLLEWLWYYKQQIEGIVLEAQLYSKSENFFQKI